MALIHRITRLVKADVNEALDRLEEPARLLRQAIRDMQEEIAAAGRQVRASECDLETLDGHVRDRREVIAELGTRLDLCFDTAREDLARGILRERLEHERVLKRLEGQRDATARLIDERCAILQQHRATLSQLQRKADCYLREPAGEADWSSRRDLWPSVISDSDVEIAFLREQSLRSGS